MCTRSWLNVLAVPTDRKSARIALEALGNQAQALVDDALMNEDFEQEIIEEGVVEG